MAGDLVNKFDKVKVELKVKDLKVIIEKVHEKLVERIKKYFSDYKEKLKDFNKIKKLKRERVYLEDCFGRDKEDENLKKLNIEIIKKINNGNEILPEDFELFGKIRENLSEIINQTANVESLLGCLEWLCSEDQGKGDFKVDICHPTTSSVKQKKKDSSEKENNEKNKKTPETNTDLHEIDHDLIIYKGDEKLSFEISDVVNKNDSNRKVLKDLLSLGILPPVKTNLKEYTKKEFKKYLNKNEFSEWYKDENKKKRGETYIVVSEEIGKKGKTLWYDVFVEYDTTIDPIDDYQTVILKVDRLNNEKDYHRFSKDLKD